MSTVTTSARPVRLHVVANRLPVTWEPTQGWVRAPGGLVTALEAYGRRRGVDWVGSSATLGEPRAVAPTWRHGPIHRVLIEPELARLAVTGLANSALWPAFHGVAGRWLWNNACGAGSAGTTSGLRMPPSRRRAPATASGSTTTPCSSLRR